MQILVVGMHRSGTSPLTRLINLMGAYVGPEERLMCPKEDNPKGFWEREDVHALHQDMLQAVDGDWCRSLPFVEGRFDLECLDDEMAAQYRQRLREILQNLEAQRPWVLKDPRLCFFFPVWQPLLEMPVCVHIYRHPIEVARSLQKRNGFPLQLGIALWEHYHLAALANTQGVPRLLVSHRHLMQQPAELVRSLYNDLVSLGVRRLSCPPEREVRACIDPQLYHCLEEQELEREILNQAQLELWHAFEAQQAFDWKVVPGLSASARETLTVYQDLQRHEAKRQHLESQTTALQAQMEKLAAEVEARGKALQTRDAEVALFQEQHGAQAQSLAAQEEKLQQLADKVEQSRGVRETLVAEVEARGKALQARDAEMIEFQEGARSWAVALQSRQAQIQTLTAEVEARGKALQTRDAEVALFQEQHGAQAQSLAAQEEKLQQLADKVEQSRGVRETLVAEVEARGKALQTRDAEVIALQKHHAMQTVSLQAQTEQLQQEIQAQKTILLEKGAEIQGIQRQEQATQAKALAIQVELSQREAELSALRMARQAEQRARTTVLQEKATRMGQMRHQLTVAQRSLFASQEQLARESVQCDKDTAAQVAQLGQSEESAAGDGLVFAQPAQPLVSVIIPVFNKWHYTYACLQAVLKNTSQVSYEVLIADDASTDETQNGSACVHNVVWVRSETTLGFVRNINTAAQHARGEYLLLLNNDTNVQAGWLESLVDLAQQDERIGIVGAKLVYPDGRLQEAGGIIWQDGAGRNYGRSDDPAFPEYNYVKEVDFCSGACLLVRKKVWEEIGGFDEQFAPAYYEDVDLAFQARSLGYRVVYQPQAVVVHFEGVSHGTQTSEGVKQHQVVNKETFSTKWHAVLNTEHGSSEEQLFLARDRSLRRDIVVVVDHLVPAWDKDAGSRAITQYIRLIQELDYKVILVGDNFYKDEPYTSLFQQMGVEVLYGPFYNREIFAEWIKENGFYIKHVIMNRPDVTYKYINLFKIYTKAHLVYHGIDIHWLRTSRRYQVEKDERLLADIERWREIEDYAIATSDTSVFVSQFEVDFLQQRFPHKKLQYAPIFSYENVPSEQGLRFENRAGLLFVGSGHPPNADGVRWFLREVFPLLKKDIPDLIFYLCGSNLPIEEEENVDILGYVSDKKLAELYRSAKVVVAPLRYGGGMKGKIIESLAFGVPAVTTPMGAEGLVDSDTILSVCDTPQNFAAAVGGLYLDKERWERQRAGGLHYIQQHFSKKRMIEAYLTILAKPDSKESCITGGTRKASVSQRGMPQTPLPVFLHMGKTGGTTVLSVLRKNYLPEEIYYVNTPELLTEFQSLDLDQKTKLKCIGGHFRYGIHEYMLQTCSYFTILRNPVERLISHYYHICRDSKHPMHEATHRMGLEDYLCCDHDIQLNNWQVRSIAGLAGLPFGACTGELLEIAKRNLQHHFAVVGIVEEFETTLRLLQERFGWKDIRYQRQNVGNYQPSQDHLSDRALEVITHNNALDIALYQEYAALITAR